MDAVVGPLTRDQIAEESKWALEGLYASDEDWQKDMSAIDSDLENYKACNGTLSESPESLKRCLALDERISRLLDKVHTYAHLRNDEDKTHSTYQGKYEQVMRLATRASQAGSFIQSELMSIPEDRMQEFLQADELEYYRLHLERLLRFRHHTLSEKEEALLAGAMNISRTASTGFEMLDNADLKLGSVQDENDREVKITHGNLISLLQNQNRRVRKEAFETFYSAYEDHQYTYAALLSGSIQKDIFFAKSRNYPSVREKALFTENIPLDVYDNLIDTVHDNMAPLFKYFAIRKRMLKLDELHVYDGFVPLVDDVNWDMPYETACDEIIKALAPLGKDYSKTLARGLIEDRWVDRYESKGKRSGAYSSGCYDSNPFILMNYRDDNINSLYTLAHEAGHSMHSYYSRNSQSYLYADYTIFVAEVASTFNEALITRHLLSQDIDKKMKIYLLCREIDNFRGTLYRQTMFAEFEHLIYKAAENDESLTVENFKKIYSDLLQLYFGDGVVLDDCLPLECFRIPHFYFSFYVYKYATGISAAYALADRVSQGGEKELADYLNFLHSGGSKYPIDLLQGAGVDMTTSEPVCTALKKFSNLVDELETLTN